MNKSLETYLNDHLAGAAGAIDAARRCMEENADTPLGQFLAAILVDIEEDEQTLQQLMERAGARRNLLKQAGAWLGEKVSRLKFGPEDKSLSNFLTVESLSLGVEGKRCLWLALKQVAGSAESLRGVDLDTLIARAENQRARLEQQRLALAGDALRSPAHV